MKKIAILIFALASAAIFGPAHQIAVVGPQVALTPEIGRSVAFAVSEPIGRKHADPGPVRISPIPKAFEIGRRDNDGKPADYISFAHDAEAAGAVFSNVQMPGPSLSFDGLSNFDNLAKFGFFLLPPDSTGDIGPNDYVQVVNSLGRVYSKAGEPKSDPFKLAICSLPFKLSAHRGTTEALSSFTTRLPTVG